MMRTLYLASSAVFLMSVAALWVGAGWFAATPATGAETSYTLKEVSRHNRADDCWMVIRGQVYDFTGYLPNHPTPPKIILPSCGTDATQAYDTKNAGRPHSPYADSLLPKYRIGVLRP